MRGALGGTDVHTEFLITKPLSVRVTYLAASGWYVHPRKSQPGCSRRLVVKKCSQLGDLVEKFKFQGLPARICWLGYKERDKAGLLFNDSGQRARWGTPS